MRECKDIKISKLTKDEKECYEAWQNFECEYDLKKHVPDAIWEVPIVRPEPPADPREIANWGKPKKERKFPRHPEDRIQLLEEYYTKYDSDTPQYQEYLEFIREEAHRRFNGFWFFRGDKLEWITDRHYMFLQYWKMPVTEGRRKKSQLPKFKDAQRDIYYCFWVARNDKSCAGVQFTSARRLGKTAVATSDGFWDTTENEESIFAIQSKTDDDAQKILRKIMKSWQKIPAFLKPLDTGDSRVKDKLVFAEPKKRDTKNRHREHQEALNSEIYSASRKEEALDGEYASYILHDEAGKLDKQIDCNERWNIARECLMDNGKVIGFGIVTTTVEDMEKYGSDKYKMLWERSNPEVRNPDGKTDSYLYRLFIPAYYGFEGDDEISDSFVDEWGDTDVDRSKAFFISMYKAKPDDMSYRRKYPITIDDAFSERADRNTFNQRKLFEQYRYVDQMLEPKALPVRGNFMWEGGTKDGNVVFHPNPDGKWLVAWHPPEDDRNRKERFASHWRPTRDFCVTGCDPFSHAQTVEKGSNGAAYTILKSHYKFPKMKMAWVCQYIARPKHPTDFYEDMILQCVYYSSAFLAENIKYDVIEHFHRRGYDGYNMYNPLDENHREKFIKGHRGIPTTHKDVREAAMSIMQAHIEDHMGLDEQTGEYGFCLYTDLLADLKRFEPNNWTPYDATVAAMITLIATKKPPIGKRDKEWNQNDWLGATQKLGRVKFSKDGVDRFRSS